MLKAIHIQNFKGIEGPISVPIKPVTLLFGANSAGKSSILHALHFIRGVLEDYDLDPIGSPFAGDAIDLGGFKNLLHKHEPSRKMVLAFDLDLSGTDLPEYGADTQLSISEDVKIARVEFVFSLDDQSAQPQIENYVVSLNGEEVAIVSPDPVHPKDGRRRLAYINLTHPLLVSGSDLSRDDAAPFGFHRILEIPTEEQLEDSSAYSVEYQENVISHPAFYFVRLSGFLDGIPRWKKLVTVAGDSRGDENSVFDLRVITELVTGPLELLRDFLQKGRAIGPLRTIPPRRLSLSSFQLETDWYGGLAAWQCLHGEKKAALIESANAWLAGSERLGTNYSLKAFEFKEIDREFIDAFVKDRTERTPGELNKQVLAANAGVRVYLQDEINGIEVTPHDVGVGLSQLIPVVIGAVDSASNFVLIEQPELHIHPRIQVGLGDLFLAESKARDCVFLVETHSEALLLRIMKRIRQTADGELPAWVEPTTPDDIAIHLIQNIGNGVVLTTVELNERGDFARHWPGGFFEETLRETM